MKKILFVTTLSGKRLNSFMLSSIVAAKSLGYEFHMACNTNLAIIDEYEKQCQEYGIHLHHVDFDRKPLKLKNIKAYKQLKKLIKENHFDILHCNTPVGGVLGRMAAKKSKGSKVLYMAHGFHFFKGGPKLNWMLYYPLEMHFSKRTDLLVTINQEDYEVSQKLKAKRTTKIHGVGFSPSEYSEGMNLRESLNLKDQFIITSVGELFNRKNHQAIIKSLKNVSSNVAYIILGFGPNKEKLEKLAKKEGVSNRVHFLGFRKNVYEILKQSDIFAFPSKREGLPLALMEAMNAGLPCVVSNIRGNNELIIQEKGGYLVSDEKDYAAYLNKLIGDTVLRLQYGAFNKGYVENFNFDIVVEEIKGLYQSLS